MQDDVSRNFLLARKSTPPLAQVLRQPRIIFGRLRGSWPQIVLNRLANRNLSPGRGCSYQDEFFRSVQPLRHFPAVVATPTTFPLGCFSEVRADLPVTAILRIDKPRDYPLSLPCTIAFRLIRDLPDEIFQQDMVARPASW